jgi:hypothetical protein
MIQERVGSAVDTGAGARVAVLVDCENISHAQADLILKSAAQLGKVIICRSYGDIRLQNGWEADHRFDSVHTGHGRSKNAADIRLAIDAMEIAYAGNVRSFVIASADGDFTPLAIKLRETDFVVVGFGKKDASKSLRQACTAYHPVLDDGLGLPGSVATDAEWPALPPGLSPDARKPDLSAQAPVLSRVDAAIHRLCRRMGGEATRISFFELGKRMPIEEGIQRIESGAASWHTYAKARPDLYLVEGSGQERNVRLVSP